MRGVGTGSFRDSGWRREYGGLRLALVAGLAALLFPSTLPAAASDEELAATRDLEAQVSYDPRKVLTEAQRLVDDPDSWHDPTARLRAWRQIALAADKIGDTARLADAAEHGPALARQLRHRVAECEFVSAAVIAAGESGRFSDALARLDQGLGYAQRQSLPYCTAQLHMARGRLEFLRGHQAIALDWLLKSYALFEAQHNKRAMAGPLLAAAIALSQDDAGPASLAKSIDYLQRAAALIDPEVHRAEAHAIYEALGVSHQLAGHYPEARRAFRQAIDLAEQLRDSAGMAALEMRLGQLDNVEDRLPSALLHLRRSLSALQEAGRFGLLLTAHVTLADVLAKQDKRRESQQELARAKALLDKLPTRRHEPVYYEKAAELQARFGDPHAAYLSLRALREAERRNAEVANQRVAAEHMVRFDVELKDAENALLRTRQQEAESRRAVTAVGFGGGFALLAAIAFFLRHRARALNRTNETLESLAAVGQEITASLDATKVFRTINRHIGRMLDAPSVSIWLLEGRELALRYGVEDGRPLPPQRERLDRDNSNVSRCARERAEIVLHFKRGDVLPTWVPGTRRNLSALFYPLIVDETVLGVLSIQSPRSKAYGRRERFIFRNLCAYGAVALANAEHAQKLAETQAELEREKLQNVLVHAGKMVAVGRLASGVIHEMSHPVNTATLLSESIETLMQSGRSEEATKLLPKIARQHQRLRQLIRRLRDFARSDEVRLTALDLRQVLADARDLFMPRLSMEGVEYREDAPAVLVQADAERLSLVIANLAFNAADAMAGRPDRLIEVGASVTDGAVTLTVRDHGPGLAPEVAARLFEPFFTTKPEGQGLGLGLALSAESMASMHGRLEAGNHPEGGAVFRVIIPLAATSTGHESPGAGAAATQKPPTVTS